MKRILIGCLLLFFLACLHAQNWPSFRGPGAAGLADGLNLPVYWDAEQSINVLWQVPIPGLSHSSPIVWGDRVFVTTAISSDPNPDFRRAFGVTRGGEGPEAAISSEDVSRQSWHIYCLERGSGRILWDKVAHQGVPRVKRHPKSTHASQTPATDGKYVVAMFGSEGLYCYDFAGNLRWSQDLGVMDAGAWDNPELHWGPASSPIIYKNLVIVQSDTGLNAFLAAFDLATGRKVWSADRPKISSWSTPTVYEGADRAELVTNGSDHIISYDPISGKELWRLNGTSKQSIPTPFAAGDLLFLFSGLHSIGPIIVIRPGGAGDITPAKGQLASERLVWRADRGASEIPTPIVYREHLYVCSNNGVLTCYKAKTGERMYRERIADGGAFAASPIAGDGRIYVTSEDGDIHVIKAGPDYELLASNSMGEVCMATPAAARGMLIVRTQHHVFAIGEK